jgi:hypothetical protein
MKLCLEAESQANRNGNRPGFRAILPIAQWRAFCPFLRRMALELFVGRTLAVMRHPVLAWVRLRPFGRVMLAAGYASLSYVTAFLTLLALKG